MCPIHENVELVSPCCGAPLTWDGLRGGFCGKCRENVGEGECPVCEEEKDV